MNRLLSLLLVILNIITFTFAIIKERFHTSHIHIAIASGAGCLFFMLSTWSVQSFIHNIYSPNLLGWIGTSIMTLIFAPPLIFILNTIDEKIHFERIDTLENLRI